MGEGPDDGLAVFFCSPSPLFIIDLPSSSQLITTAHSLPLQLDTSGDATALSLATHATVNAGVAAGDAGIATTLDRPRAPTADSPLLRASTAEGSVRGRTSGTDGAGAWGEMFPAPLDLDGDVEGQAETQAQKSLLDEGVRLVSAPDWGVNPAARNYVPPAQPPKPNTRQRIETLGAKASGKERAPRDRPFILNHALKHLPPPAFPAVMGHGGLASDAPSPLREESVRYPRSFESTTSPGGITMTERAKYLRL